MQRVLKIWDDLVSSMWFLPGAVTATAIGGAWSVLRIDRWAVDADVGTLAWAFGGGADSARQILATIAGSTITVLGVTFSLTLAALALTSTQYSPRVVRNFMRDRFNQIVFGFFAGTFVYALLVLRSIRGGDEVYVPALAVTGAIALSIVELGLLIFFIHHIAQSVQATTMIRSVAAETHREIGRVFSRSPAAVGPASIVGDPAPAPAGHHIEADGDGYVQRMDTESLLETATAEDVTLVLLVGPGDFSTRGVPLAVADRTPRDPQRFAADVCDALLLGKERSTAQDASYGFRQLVDIAVKALSPGINDPTTATNAIDHLGSLLVQLARVDWPATDFRDDRGRVRLTLPAPTFADYLSLACTEIRRYAAGDIGASTRLLATLVRVASVARNPAHREALWEEARAVVEGTTITHRRERESLDRHIRHLAAELGRDPA